MKVFPKTNPVKISDWYWGLHKYHTVLHGFNDKTSGKQQFPLNTFARRGLAMVLILECYFFVIQRIHPKSVSSDMIVLPNLIQNHLVLLLLLRGIQVDKSKEAKYPERSNNGLQVNKKICHIHLVEDRV